MKKKLKFIVFILFAIAITVFIILLNDNKPKKVTTKEKKEEKIIGNLHISIPEKFELDDNNEEDNIVYYDYNDTDLSNTCIIQIEYKDYYDTNIEQEAKDNIFVNGSYHTEEKEINNHKWWVITLRHNIKAIYYSYATTYNDKIYTIKYDDIGTGNYCDKAYNKIFKTIKFGE